MLFLEDRFLCLDFINTVFWRFREEPFESLKGYFAFIRWSQKVGLLNERAVIHLIREAQIQPGNAEFVLHRAIKLREALFRIIMLTVEHKQPENDDFNLLNSEISEMLQRTLLIHKGEKFEWGWKIADIDLDQMLWPILSSATELLSSTEIERIGICEGDGCGWLFYDNSRNHSRKWCDMGDCGNRAKARRFYKKKMENEKN